MSGMQIRLIDVLYVVMKRWRIILALGVVGFFVGSAVSGISYMQTSENNARVWCNVAITAQGADGKFPESRSIPTSSDYTLAENMAEAVAYLFSSYGIEENAVNAAGLEAEVNVSVFDTYLTVSQYGDTQIISLGLQWNDQEQGIRLIEELIECTEDAMQSAFGSGRITVIDGPEAYYTSTGGTRAFVKSAGVMGAVGALIGLGMVMMELILRPTLLDRKDVEKILKLETLGIIPQDAAYFQNRTDLLIRSEEDETSAVEQNYSSTAYILRNIMGTKNKRNCFYVTSAGDGEGKTTVAANLAIQLSAMGRRVLLVDLDTRKPSLGGLFFSAVDYSRSLNALYKGEATPQEAVNSLTGTLDFLPLMLERSGIALDDTLLEMVERLSQDYQYVIIDAPSVGKNADVLSLNRIAHMALFVVHHDMTTVQEIQTAIKTMDKSGIRILGCVLNGYQAIEWSRFLGTGKKKPQEKKKRRRRKSSDKEHTTEINALVAHDDKEEETPDEAFRKGRTAAPNEDILAEVAGDGMVSEESSMPVEDVLEALVKIGTDSTWKQKKEPRGKSGGSVLDAVDHSESGDSVLDAVGHSESGDSVPGAVNHSDDSAE